MFGFSSIKCSLIFGYGRYRRRLLIRRTPMQVPELEKPRVTELQLRMDCNGCVQKIKKALHNVDGVYDIHIDTANQKLTVVGRAELDKILKAIKKTRKIATICSHTDPNAPPPPEQPPENQPPPAPDAAPPDPPPAEAAPAKPEEPPKDPPPPPEAETKQAGPKVVEVHHYPYSYACYKRQDTPVYVYQWPPAPKFQYYDCDEEYYPRPWRGGDGGRVASAFSEENANNCSVM